MKNQPDAATLSHVYQNEISVLLRFLLGGTVTCDPTDQSVHATTLYEIAESHDRSRQAETAEPKERAEGFF